MADSSAWPRQLAGIVAFPDGRLVRGRGLRRARPEGPDPEFGVYLQGRDPGPFPWPHRWIRWPDFRTPSDTEDAMAALREVHRRAVEERVEIACGGGIGRTGTAMAVLAIWSGVPGDEAVVWVRANYQRRAVETPGQKRWLRRAAGVAGT